MSQRFRPFSKAGLRDELTSRIFSQREHILTGKQPIYRPKPADSAAAPGNTLDFEILQRELRAVLSEPSEPPKFQRQSSMFLAVPRPLHSHPADLPPVGVYNINYSSISRNVSTPVIALPTPLPAKPEPIKVCSKHKKHKKRLRLKRVSGVLFANIQPRTSKTETLDLQYSTRYGAVDPHVRSPALNKQQARGPLFASSATNLDYTPNKELVMRKLGSGVDFAKTPGRKVCKPPQVNEPITYKRHSPATLRKVQELASYTSAFFTRNRVKRHKA